MNQGTKISNTIFMYHMVGWRRNITLDVSKRRLIVTSAEDGTVLSDKDLGQDGDLNYEDFLQVAMNIHLDFIDLIHSN